VAELKSSNYNAFYSPTVSRNRSAVLVRKDIHANLMPHFSFDDLTTLMLESEEQHFLVASYYMAHDRTATYANAHHSVWGSSDINDTGI